MDNSEATRSRRRTHSEHKKREDTLFYYKIIDNILSMSLAMIGFMRSFEDPLSPPGQPRPPRH